MSRLHGRGSQMKTSAVRPVLVTDGAGYVGSHGCKALAAAGYLPVTFDKLIHGHRSAARWGPLIVGDLSDETALESAVASHRCEAVLHFAADADVGEPMRAPSKYFANNVFNSLRLIAVTLVAGISSIAFSSALDPAQQQRATNEPAESSR